MKTFTKYFKKTDFFSVSFSPAINDYGELYHKSVLGGIVSIILMILSVAYGIDQIVTWYNEELLPKVTQEYQIQTKSEKEQEYSISIEVQSTGYDLNDNPSIDPFDPQAIIILPLISPKVSEYDEFENYGSNYKDGQLQINFTLKNESQPVITFVKCDNQYLQSEQKCANEDVVNRFYNQAGNQLYIKLNFNIISPYKFETSQIARTYSLLIEQNFCTTETIYLQLSRYIIDAGYILGSPYTRYEYTDANDQSQLSSTDYCSKTWLKNTVGVIWLLNQQNIRVEKMSYPQIGDIFANIGSIISLLFMAKYIVIQINIWSLQENSLNFIIEQYYPEIKKFKIHRDWFKRIKSIKFDNKSVSINSFKQFQKKIRALIACKLNYMNLIYEVSRIQIILQSIQQRNQMRMSHLMGIKLKLQESNHNDELLIIDESEQLLQTINCEGIFSGNSNTDILQIGDAVLLGLQTKGLLKQDQIQDQQQINEFYQQNIII